MNCKRPVCAAYNLRVGCILKQRLVHDLPVGCCTQIDTGLGSANTFHEMVHSSESEKLSNMVQIPHSHGDLSSVFISEREFLYPMICLLYRLIEKSS